MTKSNSSTLPARGPELQLFQDHARQFAGNRFVYPVLSRRSGGISLGVNLNPDKVCNFDCIYCQVDRTRQGETSFVELDRLLAELHGGLELASSGAIYETEKFRHTPPALRRLNDVAFSGDGEPTTYRNFDRIVEAAAEVKRRLGLDQVKMILITNASRLHRPHVLRGLETLDANQGEIWAKLESGTEDYYRRVERTSIPFRQILDNIAQAAQVRPLVIQSLFMRILGQPPTEAELQAYCQRLKEITASGGKIRLVQVYTVARKPAVSTVSALFRSEVDAIVQMVADQTGLPALPFYGVDSDEIVPQKARSEPRLK